METALLTELTLYPIKSCAGIALRQATITEVGLMSEDIFDREWMVVDNKGCFLTQRDHPVMAVIQPRIKTDTLELNAPGMLPINIPLGLPDPDSAPTLRVRVWDDEVLAYDCDDITALWFSKAIGVPCRLARFHPLARRDADREWTGGVAAPTMFSDGFPLLMIYQASLDELNRRLRLLQREPLPMNRFRPNLVLSGTEAFEEDFAESIELGDAVIKAVKPCPRCPVPSVDQATGVPGPDPRDVLRSERSDPRLKGQVTFGSNCILLQGEGAILRVGQAAGIVLAF